MRRFVNWRWSALVTAVLLGEVLVGATLAIASCANTTAFVVSAQTLDSVGAAVELTHDRFEACAAARTCSASDVATWNAFQAKFQQAYPAAVTLWKAARRTNDAALTGRAADIITALVAELAPLAAQVGVLVSPAAGAP